MISRLGSAPVRGVHILMLLGRWIYTRGPPAALLYGSVIQATGRCFWRKATTNCSIVIISGVVCSCVTSLSHNIGIVIEFVATLWSSCAGSQHCQVVNSGPARPGTPKFRQTLSPENTRWESRSSSREIGKFNRELFYLYLDFDTRRAHASRLQFL